MAAAVFSAWSRRPSASARVDPQVLDQDWRNSQANGGRSIFGWEPPPKRIRSG
jgi:hypothetical protein